ncbi:MAG: four helix bundle protein [Saprospiraceae bacterium]
MKEILLNRTKGLALTIIYLIEKLPKNMVASVVGKQIVRSGTSVGANYRAACRGKSKADFINKLKIVEEELDETIYWLEIIIEAGLLKQEVIIPIKKEAIELISIFVATLKTAKL